MFSLKNFADFVHPFFSTSLSSFHSKDLVLFLGLTGSGKSTTVNYLLGHKFIIDEGGAARSSSKTTLPAKMADGAMSVTSYPAVYSLPVKDEYSFALSDCPGFADNRSVETQVGISLCLNAAVHMARNIKAIIVVIDYAAISAERSAPFLQIISSIAEIIDVPNPHSLFFIFNRLPQKITENYLVKKLADLLKKEQTIFAEYQLKRTQQMVFNKIQHSEKLVSLLAFMIEHPKTFFFIDVFDAGESRSALLKKLSLSPQIPKEHINFASSEQSLKNFEEVLISNLLEYKKLIELYETKLKIHSDLESSLFSVQSRLNEIKAERNQLEQKIKIASDVFMLAKQQLAFANEKKIDACTDKLNKEQTDLKDLHQELVKLDAATEVYYKSLAPSYNIEGFFSNDTVYSYNGVPFTDITVSNVSDGKYKIKLWQPSLGRYEGKYKRSVFGSNSNYPTVKVWVQSRNLPGNAKKITELKCDILKKESDIKKLELEILELHDDFIYQEKKLSADYNTQELGCQLSMERLQQEVLLTIDIKNKFVVQLEQASSDLKDLTEFKQKKQVLLQPIIEQEMALHLSLIFKNKKLDDLVKNFILDCSCSKRSYSSVLKSGSSAIFAKTSNPVSSSANSSANYNPFLPS